MFDRFEKMIRHLLPDAKLDVSESSVEDGYTLMSVIDNGTCVAVRWNEKEKFGIAVVEDGYYGWPVHEDYEYAEEAAARIHVLVTTNGKTERI